VLNAKLPWRKCLLPRYCHRRIVFPNKTLVPYCGRA
jgi:hypothetical protein